MSMMRILYTGFKPGLLLLICLATLGVTAPALHATESGGGSYPNGAEGFGAGMLPPPGTYFLNYFNVYNAPHLNNGSGNSMVSDFNLTAVVNAFRLVHVTKIELLGGNLGGHLLLPVVNLDVTMGGRSQSRFGLGDLTVGPLITWHTKNLHTAVGLDTTVPSGRYDKNDLANIGRNYWTFEPIVAATWLTDSGFELSGKFMYDINTKNSDTDYLSGQEFHVDYTVAQKFNNLSVGLGGYFYKQVTDDELHGTKVALNDGFKGQALALGPQLKYDYKNMFFILKYQREMAVENRPEGNKFWFKMMYAF